MDNKYKHIFMPSECPNEDVLAKYASGFLDKVAKHKIEMHLTECEMCNDVVEGLADLDSINDFNMAVDDLNMKIDSSIIRSNRSPYFFLKIAASFLLIAMLSFFVYNLYLETEDVSKKPLAAEDVKSVNDIALLEIEDGAEEEIKYKKKDYNDDFAHQQKTLGTSLHEPNPVSDALEPTKNLVDYSLSEVEKTEISGDFITPSPVFAAQEEKQTTGKATVASRSLDSERHDENILAETVSYQRRGRSKKVVSNDQTPKSLEDKDLEGREMENIAISEFERSEYQNALALFLQLPENDLSLYYIGMCYYHINDYFYTVEYLKKVQASSGFKYHQETKWFYALSLIKINKKEQAVGILEAIVDSGGKYAETAKKLLIEL